MYCKGTPILLIKLLIICIIDVKKKIVLYANCTLLNVGLRK